MTGSGCQEVSTLSKKLLVLTDGNVSITYCACGIAELCLIRFIVILTLDTGEKRRVQSGTSLELGRPILNPGQNRPS